MAAVALLALAAGCARMVPPSGGPEDKDPPRIVRHEPDSSAVRVAQDAALRIWFSEPMHKGLVRDWLLVAPWPGRLECAWDSTCITCTPIAGWPADAAHTVVLGSEVTDRRRNRLERPLEFAFTTGESLPSGTITGVVRTRALKAQGVPVCLFPWPAGGLAGEGPTQLPAPDARSALCIAETDAEGRFRLRHVPREGEFLLGALWDEARDRVYDLEDDLWGFYPVAVRAEARGDTARAAAPADSGAAPGLEVYLVYPDEPGDIAGAVIDSACDGYIAPAVHRARADSLRSVLDGEIDAMGFSGAADSAAVVALAPAEEESLRVGLARADSLLTGALRDSLRCGGPIWVSALAEGDSVPAAEVRAAASFELTGLPAGIYRVSAFRDLNGDGEEGAGEPRGAFPTCIDVAPGRTVAGVSFPLEAPPAREGAP